MGCDSQFDNPTPRQVSQKPRDPRDNDGTAWGVPPCSAIGPMASVYPRRLEQGEKILSKQELTRLRVALATIKEIIG